MTQKEYFENHIPHRINLLITFKVRFSKLSEKKRQNIRDLFRCSKDISILMCRFFLEELGIKLKRNSTTLIVNKDKELDVRRNELKIKPIEIKEIDDNKILYNQIVTVLEVANRAVAHIDEKDVNHAIKITKDEDSLIGCINYIEGKINTNMYDFAGFDLEKIMKDKDNNMHRERLKLN